jgi:UDP-3-O-[3-hydroxymyristoyl] N-acetylglucosamine deacetylase
VIEAVVEGIGLHTGQPARVIVRARPGPVTLRVGALEARIDELTVGSTARATTVEARGRARDGARAGPFRVGTVEHAFAALAGLGIYEGLGMDVDGPELPLLDGGASAWCAVIDGLGVMASAPRTRVARREALTIGASRYEFCPGDGVRLEVRLELEGFDERIVAPDGALSAGRPFEPDEPARHKLLDLVGDLYLYGGPPVGHVRAVRPGHAANALAMRRARDEGIVVSD